MREQNIQIDMVAGTSIGGILGAGIAMEWDLPKFLEITQTAFLIDKPLKDYTLPIISLIKGHQLQKVNHLLIDGGIFNNFPVDLMHTKFGGKIIGIDLKVYKEYELDYVQIPGGWYMLFAKFMPFLKRYKVPGIAAIMMKATWLASTSQQKEAAKYVDFYLNPPVGGFGLLKLEKFHDIVKIGYVYGKEYFANADLTKLYQ